MRMKKWNPDGVSKRTLTFLLVGWVSTAAPAGELQDGTLVVDGKPFFPLGSWSVIDTAPEDVARLDDFLKRNFTGNYVLLTRVEFKKIFE